MAKKRMVSNQIVDSDAFLDMPLSAQALYLHLLVRADDEGFNNSVKKVMRMIGARDDDLKVLIGKRFVVMFDSGVLVIKHWLIHNTIRSERVIETVHTKEKQLLTVKPNKSYSLVSAKQCQQLQNVVHVSDTRQTDVTIEEISLDKISIEEKRKEKEGVVSKPLTKNPIDLSSYSQNFVSALDDFKEMRKKIKSPMTDRAIVLLLNKLDELASDEDSKIKILEQSIMGNWKSVYELKTNGTSQKNLKSITRKNGQVIDEKHPNWNMYAKKPENMSVEDWERKEDIV